jgi:hypothetical protein
MCLVWEEVVMNEQDLILRVERQSLLIGTMIGQMSELLNNVKSMTVNQIYKSLLDITTASSLHINELYYKGNKK